MTDYYDRNGEPLELGDAVLYLGGDEESGYTAIIAVIDPPQTGRSPMLLTYRSFANIWTHIPTDKEELRRRRFTRIGPHNGIDLKKFEQWRYEIGRLAESGADIDREFIKGLKFLEGNGKGHY